MLTPEQKEARKKYIGSSDASALVNQNPYKSAYDVWLEKTGKVDGSADTVVTRAGQYMKSAILDWTQDQLGVKLERNQMIVHPNRIACANLDAVAQSDPPVLIEAKSVGLMADPKYINQFGEPGSDELPPWITIQASHQIMVAREQPDLKGVRLVIVPALIVRRGFVVYQVEANEELIGLLQEEEERFWRDHVLADVPPESSAPSLEVVKRVTRIPNKITRLELAYVDEWLAAKAELSQAEAKKKHAEARMLAALGDAEAGELPDGRILTYFSYHRKGYTVADTDYRQLRIKGGK